MKRKIARCELVLTEVLTGPYNVDVLTGMSGRWVDPVRARRFRGLILDSDSPFSETYGCREGTTCNGHLGCTCYYALFCVNQLGDLERALLREGNAHSADDRRSGLEPPS